MINIQIVFRKILIDESHTNYKTTAYGDVVCIEENAGRVKFLHYDEATDDFIIVTTNGKLVKKEEYLGIKVKEYHGYRI